ncbi:MAG: PadR family transcriptional regulator [Nanoarchaeota archaeon]
MRGYLKLIVLTAISKKERSGYDLMKYIEQETGTKPSSGSIYPVLDSLATEGFIRSVQKDRKKSYHITGKGKGYLKKILKKKEDVLGRIVQFHQFLGLPADEYKALLKFINARKTKDTRLHHSFGIFMGELTKKMVDKRSNQAKLLAFLRKETKELEKI